MHKRMQCTHVTDTKPATLVTIVMMCVCVQTVTTHFTGKWLAVLGAVFLQDGFSEPTRCMGGGWMSCVCLIRNLKEKFKSDTPNENKDMSNCGSQ